MGARKIDNPKWEESEIESKTKLYIFEAQRNTEKILSENCKDINNQINENYKNTINQISSVKDSISSSKNSMIKWFVSIFLTSFITIFIAILSNFYYIGQKISNINSNIDLKVSEINKRFDRYLLEARYINRSPNLERDEKSNLDSLKETQDTFKGDNE